MRLLLAFLRAGRLDALLDAIGEHHAQGLSISSCEGFGQEHNARHPDHEDYLGVELTPKLRVELVCHEKDVDELLEAFYAALHTGKAGDGKVFVLPVIDALRLKTGERGPEALGPSDH